MKVRQTTINKMKSNLEPPTRLFIRSFEIDNVKVSLTNDEFIVQVGDKQEIGAQRSESGDWLLYDGLVYSSEFSSFEELWDHIIDLANLYGLFPYQWKTKHFENLCALFGSVK